MALIKCSECGKEISSSAKVCPNCGCPTTKIQEINESLMKQYHLSKGDISTYKQLGGEVPLQEIPSFVNEETKWVILGFFLPFLLLIPYFKYKQQDRPKTARYFLMLFILYLVLMPIAIGVLTFIMVDIIN